MGRSCLGLEPRPLRAAAAAPADVDRGGLSAAVVQWFHPERQSLGECLRLLELQHHGPPGSPATRRRRLCESPTSMTSAPLCPGKSTISSRTQDRKSTRLNSSHTVISYAA